MYNLKKKAAGAALAVLLPGALWAAPDMTLRGFGTLGLVHNGDDGAALVRDIGQPDGPRDETRFDTDSRLGAQIDALLTPRWSTSAQVISRYNHAGKYSLRLNRAFLKYEGGASGVAVRLGRYGWDIYHLSDSRHVGYALLWVRPPVEYFGKLQQEALDGADLSFTRPLGQGTWGAKLYWGRAEEKAAIDDHSYTALDGTRVYGGHLEFQQGRWSARFSAARVEAESEIRGRLRDQLNALLSSGDPQVVAELLRSSAFASKVDADILAASLVYDNGPLTAQMMLGRDEFPDFAEVDETWRGFMTLSYRLGAFRPFVTYAHAESHPHGASGNHGGANLLAEDQYNLSAGVRYDFRENWALKLQADHVNASRDGRTSILLKEVQPGWDGKLNLLSLSLDFVF